MASVNKAILLGNLTRDVEVRYLPNGDAVATFSIATNERWTDKSGQKQEKAEFHNIVMYRRLAEVAGEYLKKGRPVYLEGRLHTREWEKDGVKRYTTEIIADSMQLLGNGGGRQEDDAGFEQSAPRQQGASSNDYQKATGGGSQRQAPQQRQQAPAYNDFDLDESF